MPYTRIYQHIPLLYALFFFFNDTATTEIYTLSLHDALPISSTRPPWCGTTVAIRCAPTGGNRSATAGRRRCSRPNGPRSTTIVGTFAGRAGCTARDRPPSLGGRAPPWGNASGARGPAKTLTN